MTPQHQQKIQMLEFKINLLRISIKSRQRMIDTMATLNGRDLDALQNFENDLHRTLTRQTL